MSIVEGHYYLKLKEGSQWVCDSSKLCTWPLLSCVWFDFKNLYIFNEFGAIATLRSISIERKTAWQKHNVTCWQQDVLVLPTGFQRNNCPNQLKTGWIGNRWQDDEKITEDEMSTSPSSGQQNQSTLSVCDVALSLKWISYPKNIV